MKPLDKMSPDEVMNLMCFGENDFKIWYKEIGFLSHTIMSYSGTEYRLADVGLTPTNIEDLHEGYANYQAYMMKYSHEYLDTLINKRVDSIIEQKGKTLLSALDEILEDATSVFSSIRYTTTSLDSKANELASIITSLDKKSEKLSSDEINKRIRNVVNSVEIASTIKDFKAISEDFKKLNNGLRALYEVA